VIACLLREIGIRDVKKHGSVKFMQNFKNLCKDKNDEFVKKRTGTLQPMGY